MHMLICLTFSALRVPFEHKLSQPNLTSFYLSVYKCEVNKIFLLLMLAAFSFINRVYMQSITLCSRHDSLARQILFG